MSGNFLFLYLPASQSAAGALISCLLSPDLRLGTAVVQCPRRKVAAEETGNIPFPEAATASPASASSLPNPPTQVLHHSPPNATVSVQICFGAAESFFVLLPCGRLSRVHRSCNKMLRFALRWLFCLQPAAGGDATGYSVLLTVIIQKLLTDIEFALI